MVAPRAGAWIETHLIAIAIDSPTVAPRAGAWIETENGSLSAEYFFVAPRAGAWIETRTSPHLTSPYLGRSPRGSVD